MSDNSWTSIASPGGNVSAAEAAPQRQPPGPPYPPTSAVVGGVPKPALDDPISAVLAVLFIAAAVVHMVIFQFNRKRGHLFVFSAMMFAFCMIRAAALVMRMVWASHTTNVRIAIAANILTQAGTLVVFIINLFLTQRLVRGYHPKFGWSTRARFIFRFLVVACIACLIMLIAVTVQSFYTLDTGIKSSDRAVQLFAGTFLMIIALAPLPIIAVAALAPRKYNVEKFGEGSWRAKLLLVLGTSTLLTIGAGFRVGTNFDARPLANPAWFTTNVAGYYIFNFVIDVVVAYVYIAAAFHKRFFVPAGAKGPGSYSTINSYNSEKSRPASEMSQHRGGASLKKPGAPFSHRSSTLVDNRASAALSYAPDLPPGVQAYMRYAEELEPADVESQQPTLAGAQRDEDIASAADFPPPPAIRDPIGRPISAESIPCLSGQGSTSALLLPPQTYSDEGSVSGSVSGSISGSDVPETRVQRFSARSAPGTIIGRADRSESWRRRSGD